MDSVSASSSSRRRGSLRVKGVSFLGANLPAKREFRNHCLRPSFRPFVPSSCLPLDCRRTRQAAGWEEDIYGYTRKHVDFAPRTMDSAHWPKGGRLDRECHARWRSSNAAEIRQAARSIRCFRYSNSHRACWRSRSMTRRMRTEYHSNNRPKPPAGERAHT